MKIIYLVDRFFQNVNSLRSSIFVLQVHQIFIMKQEFKGPIDRQSFEFAIKVVRIYKMLVENQKEYVLSKQFLRSGTAVGALVREGQNAESKKDFIHKYHIAQKECDETIYWLYLLNETDYLDHELAEKLLTNAKEILRMLRSAILTTKNCL